MATPITMERKTFPVLILQRAVQSVANQPQIPDANAAGIIKESRIVPGKASMKSLNLPLLGKRPANNNPPNRKPYVTKAAARMVR